MNIWICWKKAFSQICKLSCISAAIQMIWVTIEDQFRYGVKYHKGAGGTLSNTHYYLTAK